jgi:hypothetical protein
VSPRLWAQKGKADARGPQSARFLRILLKIDDLAGRAPGLEMLHCSASLRRGALAVN